MLAFLLIVGAIACLAIASLRHLSVLFIFLLFALYPLFFSILAVTLIGAIALHYYLTTRKKRHAPPKLPDGRD